MKPGDAEMVPVTYRAESIRRVTRWSLVADVRVGLFDLVWSEPTRTIAKRIRRQLTYIAMSQA